MKSIFITIFFLTNAFMTFAWKPIMVGHRGSKMGVENTVEAYQNGVDVFHYDGLECDVRVTSDKQLVILHNETTETLGGNLNVANSTLAELKAETLTQNNNGVQYSGKICTVAEYLDVCVQKNVFPLIELKWTTGINNTDMSNFPLLASLVEQKGLSDKVVFLTSMKQSLEYIRKNYPSLKCQYLFHSDTQENLEWCKKNQINASFEKGDFDIYTVKRYREQGLNVAVWTVNNSTTYSQYGEMGVYMMTCDNLDTSGLSDLKDIDWDAVVEPLDPLEIETSVLFRKCVQDNTLPENFPSGSNAFNTSQESTCINDTFYINNYGSSKLLVFTKDGEQPTDLVGGSSHGIAADDAGNLIIRNDGVTSTPSKLILFRHGTTIPLSVDFTLKNNGITNFISASGDIFSATGGVVYLFPKDQTTVQMLNFSNGVLNDITVSESLSMTASTASYIIPIPGEPNSFIYQDRQTGYYHYRKGQNKGDYLTGSPSTTAPARNHTIGGVCFFLDGHELFVSPSGKDYNGGLSIRDMSAEKKVLGTFDPLGNVGYTGNPSCGSFLSYKKIDDKTVNIYDYCLGNGIAAYQIKVKGSTSAIKEVLAIQKVTCFPNPSDGILNIHSEEIIKTVSVFNGSGELLRMISPVSKSDSIQIDLSVLPSGIYFLQVNGQKMISFIKN